MATDPGPSAKEEYENATRAEEDIGRTGATERRCLRCGGRFLHEDNPSYFILRCESCDYKVTSRGL